MAWELTGTTGTNPANNFLGTTDQRPVVIKTNNKEAVRVNPDGPASKVEIAAQDGLAVTGDRPFITLRDANAGNAHSILKCLGGDMALIPNTADGATPAMVLKANTGNVGIGTLNPSSKVEIAAADGLAVTGDRPFITLRDANAGNARCFVQCLGGDMALVPNNPGGAIPAMVLKANTDNVGIGTLNPSTKLTIEAQDGHGLFSRSETANGIIGHSHGDPAGGNAGVFGEHLNNGTGVTGKSDGGIGVVGVSEREHGVFGESHFSRGVGGISGTDIGVFGFAHHGQGVRGEVGIAGGIGVFGVGPVAGRFEGVVEVRSGASTSGTVSTGVVDIQTDISIPALSVSNSAHGEIMIGAGGGHIVFRVLNNGDVQVRGVTLNCDRNVKANFSNVNTRQVLERLSCMPIAEWNYKADPTSVHHIGPTSQDFKLAFGLNGDEDERISVVDAQGIALAAIQGLNEKLNTENAQLRANVVSLETRLAAIESNLRAAGISAGIMETVHLPPLG
jgi:Chaperone of endosialidase